MQEQKTDAKIKIFVDADDTVIESSKTVIDIINERYDINPPKTFQNLHNWNYTCIHPSMTPDEVNEIYASDEFFERVQPNPSFVKVYEKHKDNFDFFVVTKGDAPNLDKKEQWFHSHFPEMNFIGIEFIPEAENFDKSIIPMKGGIQIDDRTDALVSTTASCKMLLQNGIRVAWNRPKEGANLYVVQTWEEIGQVLDFTVKCPEWFLWDGGNE